MKIRIGGVPEHFNMPWHMAIENKIFESKGLEVEWVTFKGGTGAMCNALRDEEVDLCVILTEGVVKDIVNGNPSKIVSKYINTPLIWGVHTSAKNDLNFYGETFQKKYAISRKGSGSHLMPQVDAMVKDKSINEDQFIPVKNLEGALQSLKNLETDVFYWEKYTTKPYVDSGELKYLGEFVTPWPCFVLAATESFISSSEKELKTLVDTIQFVSDQFVKIPDVVQQLSQTYNQKYKDIENWFHSTEWATDTVIPDKMISNVLHSLKRTGLIGSDMNVDINQIVHQLNQ